MSTQAFSILVADDESPARNRLRTLLSEIDPQYVISEAKNGHEVLDFMHQNLANIVLLDIRMPGLDGLETAQHLNKMIKPPAIIFTTAFDVYALQAFDLHAIDYLLKPIRLERLTVAINKARALLPNQLQALNPLIPTRTHISIVERGRVLLIPINEIIYFRAELKYITVRTAAREFLLEDSLTNLEQTFDQLFVRIHRNCLVAQAYILGFDKRMLTAQERQNLDAQNLVQKNTDGSVTSENAADEVSVAKEKQWVALLKGVPEVIPVSRRQQHLIRDFVSR